MAIRLFRAFFRGRAVQAAFDAIVAGTPVGDGLGRLAKLSPDQRGEGAAELALRLLRAADDEDERLIAAALISARLGVEASGGSYVARTALASVAFSAGEDREGEEALLALLAERPGDGELAAWLGEHLLAADRPAEALALLEPLRAAGSPAATLVAAKVCFWSDRTEEALELATAVRGHLEHALQDFTADRTGLRALHQEASQLCDEAIAELDGREAVSLRAGSRARLDARAGVNFTLLGEAMQVESGRIAAELELRTPAGDLARGRALGATAHGDALAGIAELREGKLEAALKRLHRAADRRPACFAAYLGLGAAMDLQRFRGLEHVRRLPPAREHPVISAVVAEHAALSELERRVVHACALPLIRPLSVAAERGARMRVLPLDVRVTDLPELSGVRGERAEDDHRAYDALGGLATPACAAAKVERLLDLASAGGLVFAHELAHLAGFHLPESRRDELLDLYERACEDEWAMGQYAISDPDELFAEAYTAWLRERLDLPRLEETEGGSLARELGELFRRIEGLDA